MHSSDDSGVPQAGPAEDQPPVPAAIAAAWREAESRLFSALMGSPDLYQRVTELVGATVRRLRELGSSPVALREAAGNIADVVRAAGDDDGLSAVGVDPELVGRAALALRLREVAGEQATARRLANLAAARARDETWAVLEERGDWVGDPFTPYRRLEVRVATGTALLVATAPDEQFRTVSHTVEVLQVDLSTGGLKVPSHPPVGPSTHLSAADREAWVASLRHRFSGPG